jgi:6-phosphofructokinase 2
VERLELEEVNEAAKQIIAKGGAEIVVVSWTARCFLVTKDSYEFVPAPNVAKKNCWCCDSMVGGIGALSQNKVLKLSVGSCLWISSYDE